MSAMSHDLCSDGSWFLFARAHLLRSKINLVARQAKAGYGLYAHIIGGNGTIQFIELSVLPLYCGQ